MSTRTRFSELRPGVPAAMGVHPSELWGVGTGPHKRNRSEASRARRRAKKEAKAKGVTLKAYLREQGANTYKQAIGRTQRKGQVAS